MNPKRILRRTVLLAFLIAIGVGLIPVLTHQAQETKKTKKPVRISLRQDNAPLDRSTKAPTTTSYAGTIKKASPSVVNVYSTKLVLRGRDPFRDDPLLRRFFREPNRQPSLPNKQKRQSLGSGVIATPDGYILTNNHVVAGADEIKIVLTKDNNGKKEYTAKVIGTDPKTDLAVLKIDVKGLPAITMTDSDASEVGDVVFAIGNPFGVGQTVTMGIISAKGRALGMVDYENFIQTDASINPGNSGGALIDAKGRLIGINTAIMTRSGGSQGIGFAVPANLVRKIMTSLLSEGKVSRGFLGINIQDVTPDLKEAFKLSKREGAIVTNVEPDGAAAAAGVKEADVIIEFQDKKIRDIRHLRLLVAGLKPGTEVKFKVVRAGSEKILAATLRELPTDKVAAKTKPGRSSGDLLKGISVKVLDDTLRT